ncbi:phosphotransferase [Sphaerisporangium corydalis]|uniref:Phosphotransferase n=1 Tax=Sphaerisporangium corydalis TaxID=1441875 RepID=A0ABV9EKJ0_9ACTN|nr:phosphotransferase [Sphaerisporangium corydalis]
MSTPGNDPTGPAVLGGPTDLTELVRESLGDRGAEIAEQRVEPIGAPGSPSTGGLHRVSGVTTSGARWSFVAKSIRSLRHWPAIGSLPASFRSKMIAEFPWRADLDVYLKPFPLPDGLRLPRLHRVDDLGDDRLVMWLEDVREAPGPWDLGRYRSAAGLLGRLAAMNPVARGARPQLSALRHFADGPVASVILPQMRDPATWDHPLVAPYVDAPLREDLLALSERITWLLDAVDELPHTLAHGDACPQNLLVPALGPADFVAIDWSWPTPLPVGFDLGQLLVGLPYAGTGDPSELTAVHSAILAAYTAELTVDPGQVRFGYVASLVLRNAWTALPLERLGETPTPELHELFRARAPLARFVADLGRAMFL